MWSPIMGEIIIQLDNFSLVQFNLHFLTIKKKKKTAYYPLLFYPYLKGYSAMAVLFNLQ